MLPQAATDFYSRQQRVNEVAAQQVRRAWHHMGDNFDASWRRIAPTVLATLVQSQAEMTKAARDYVPRVLAETNIPDRPEGDFQPSSLVGTASDGRPLDSLAYGAVTTAKQAIADGKPTGQALAEGGDWLDLMTKLQVADAARQAVGVLTASRKNLGGTVRVLNPPSCQRCAILAGRFYRWSQGFLRHPRCDCVNLPAEQKAWAEAEGFITDPMEAYRQGHIRDLTDAQKFAIDNGADIGQVVNAYRGMSTTATRRASKTSKVWRDRNAAAPVANNVADVLANIQAGMTGAPVATRTAAKVEGILTPEGIYQQAKSREQAIELLREHGYIH